MGSFLLKFESLYACKTIPTLLQELDLLVNVMRENRLPLVFAPDKAANRSHLWCGVDSIQIYISFQLNNKDRLIVSGSSP